MVTSNRSRIWAALFDAYVGSAMTIILGYGLGAAEHLGLHADAHNYYLQILVETGIIGACCFVVLVVLYMRGMLRYEFADGLARRAVLLSVMVVFLAWMFSSLNGVLDFIAILVGLGAGLVATSSGDAKLGETASGEIGGYQRDPS
jgi:O-antigen ligase